MPNDDMTRLAKWAIRQWKRRGVIVDDVEEAKVWLSSKSPEFLAIARERMESGWQVRKA